MKLQFDNYVVQMASERSEFVSKRYEESGLNFKSTSLSKSSSIIECYDTSTKRVIGSVTVSLDAKGVPFVADERYSEELNEFRGRGDKLAEFTKFAIERGQDTRFVMACLFNYIYRIYVIKHGVTHFVAEALPEHVRPYSKLLNFKLHGPAKWNPVAQKEAYLLILDNTLL